MDRQTTILLDGSTGEGGGQLVRNAIALAAVACRPVKITNVRANRIRGGKGGGLKAQHVCAIKILAQATDAQVAGLEVGSPTVEFRPRRRPGLDAVSAMMKASPPDTMTAEGGKDDTGSDTRKNHRLIRVVSSSPASSAMCIFQAVFPFLLFAGGKTDKADGGEEDPIELEIDGGTNVSWSPSWDFVDQVLCPALETWFGVAVERRLVRRGWNSGPVGHGRAWFRFRPLRLGYALRGPSIKVNQLTKMDLTVKTIDATIVCSAKMGEKLTRALAKDLAALFPDAEVRFRPAEDAGYHSRMFVLLVARPASGPLVWGRDLVFSPDLRGGAGSGSGGKPKRRKKKDVSGGGGERKPRADVDGDEWMLSTSELISRRLCRDLHRDVTLRRGVVDEFLQDQLVIFQALCDGRSSFPRGEALPEQTGGEGEGEGEGGNATTEEDALEMFKIGDEVMKMDPVEGPVGEGSLHTRTARWVAAKVLGDVMWFENGKVCEGVGMVVPPAE